MRRKDRKVDLLRGVGLFSACTDRELGKVARLVTEVAVPAGRVLVEQGEPGREFFVIRDGSAKVLKNGRKVATLGPGAFFGELALLYGGPRTATVVADTPMALYALHAQEFSALLEDAPTVPRKILRALAVRLRESEKSHTH